MKAHTLLIATVVVLSLPHSASPVRAQEPPSSRECTISGTADADVLVGTEGDDVICGEAGDDLILGNGGNDILIGGPGHDKLRGHAGDDVLIGGAGRDTLLGNEGRDLLLGEAGRDSLIGGRQGDQFIGGKARDRVLAATTDDACAEDDQDLVDGSCATDRTPPEISEAEFSRSPAAGSTLTVSWRVTDSSGVVDSDGSAGSWLWLGGASGWVRWCDLPLLARRISGDAFDGRYEVTCAIPADAVNGEYGLFFGASDAFGNSAFSDGADSFTIVDGSADDDTPEVSELSITAASFTPGESLTFRWRATDTTGVAYVIPWAFGPNGFLVNESGELWLSYGVPTLVEGDALDGVYEVELRLSAAAIPGTYSIWLSLGDVLGNRTFTPTASDGTAYGTFDVNP